MLGASLRDRPARERLLSILLSTHEAHPDLYDDQWIPYLGGRREPWPEPFGTVSSLDELERAAYLLPGARFKLSLGHRARDTPRFDAVAYLSDPRVARVGALCLYGLELTGDEFERVLAIEWLTDLVELDLGRTRIDSLEPLFAYPGLEHLEVLDLQDLYDLDGGDCERLMTCGRLTSLRVLDISNIYSWRGHVTALEASENLPELTSIYTE